MAYPGLAEFLREEVQSVLKEHRGAMNTQSLFSMKVLDSVMRESQRMNPLNMGGYPPLSHKTLILIIILNDF